ncbi:MAG: Mbeg1-like protein [Anaeroplasmataceae bacterium]
MSKGVFDYLDTYGNRSIKKMKLNHVDQLIFAELSYLNFEKFDNLFYRLQPISSLKEHSKMLSEDTLFKDNNEKLFLKAIESKRFSKLMLGEVTYYTYRNVGFYAMLFKLGNKYIIAFRGTDPTIASWRENLNMLVNERMPSHQLGLDYITRIMDKYNGEFYIVGHSKGGNIAVYCMTYLNKNYQRRIKEVLDFDGPGFLDGLYDTKEYKRVKNKIKRYVPFHDMVGILLNHSSDYKTVKCNGILINQHDLFAWQVNGCEFRCLRDVNRLIRVADKAMYSWINSLNLNEKKKFLYILNDIFVASEITEITEIKANMIKSTVKLIKSYKALSKEDKRMFRTLIFRLMKYYVSIRITG